VTHRFRHPIRIGLAIAFLLLGIIGLLIPIMPQTIFFIIAIALFFPSHPRVEKALKKFEPKWPRVCNLLRKLGVGDEISTPAPGSDPPPTSL
jgi:uncharacterized membrane protein YbaN (DUF454 family)